jgi:hypothetical protein
MYSADCFKNFVNVKVGAEALFCVELEILDDSCP